MSFSQWEIPAYSVCCFVGLILAATAAFLLGEKSGAVHRRDIAYSAVCVLLGAVLGAKLLYIFVSFKDFATLVRQVIDFGLPWYTALLSGFVFYGGLLGGILALYLYARHVKLPFSSLADLYAVVVPLGHAVGRVGCHLAGCCYGMPYDGPFSVTYTESFGSTPIGVPLIPVQLIEAVCLLLLFAVQVAVYLKVKKPTVNIFVYAIAYAVIRFVLEFFRYDTARGLFFGLSTSQWISLAILGTAVGVIVYLNKQRATHSRG